MKLPRQRRGAGQLAEQGAEVTPGEPRRAQVLGEVQAVELGEVGLEGVAVIADEPYEPEDSPMSSVPMTILAIVA